MSAYRIEILVTPRPGLLDPEGNAIHHALRSLGYDGVEAARVGKVIYLDIHADREDAARDAADEMCRKVLANPVTQDYEIHVVAAATKDEQPTRGPREKAGTEARTGTEARG